MSAARLVLVLCLLSGALGCAEDGPPTLVLATQPACAAEQKGCNAAGATRFSVDGVSVIHQRVAGHPLVALRLTFDRSPDHGGEQRWAETLALSLLGAAGPRRLGYGDWEARLADLSSDLSVGTGSDYLSFSITAPRPHWRTVWNLMSEAVKRPSTDEYLLLHRQRAIAASYEGELDDAENAARFESFSRAFRGLHLNAAREHLAALQGLRVTDVERAWRSLRTKRRLMVTVVGDVAEGDVRAAVKRAFADLADDYESTYRRPSPTLGDAAPVAVLDYPDVPTWHVRSFFLGPPADSAEYATLWLGLSVFSERLYDQIRDAEGLAYTAGAALSFYRQSYGSIWMSTPQPARAFAITRAIVAQLKDEGPSEGELARARAAFQKELLDERATPTGMAWSLADWQLTAGSFSTDGAWANVEAATPQDVAAVLTAWLRDVKTVAAGSGEPLTEAALTALYE